VEEESEKILKPLSTRLKEISISIFSDSQYSPYKEVTKKREKTITRTEKVDTPLTELTDGQLKFMFHAKQERERIKSEKLDEEKGSSNNMSNNQIPSKFR
jgi:hypothetical protein